MHITAIIIQNLPFYGAEIIEELTKTCKLSQILFVEPNESAPDVAYSYAKNEDFVLVFAEESEISKMASLLETEADDFLQCFEDGAGVFTKGGAEIILIPIEEEKRRLFLKNVCFPRLKRRGAIPERLIFRGVGCDKKLFLQCKKRAETLAFASNHRLEIFFSERYDDVRIEIDYPSDVPKHLLDEATRIFAEAFSEELYALNDTPLERRLCELLKVRGKRLSVAESFTGGGVASRIVSVSGASEVYFEGLNTYNGDSKIKRLNVSPFTLNTMGAVSDQTAYEMCAGLLCTGDVQAVIATTGLAGPKSDESGLPVGLCYLAVGVDGKIYIAKHLFTGTRKEITEKAINHALFWAYKHLK